MFVCCVLCSRLSCLQMVVICLFSFVVIVDVCYTGVISLWIASLVASWFVFCITIIKFGCLPCLNGLVPSLVVCLCDFVVSGVVMLALNFVLDWLLGGGLVVLLIYLSLLCLLWYFVLYFDVYLIAGCLLVNLLALYVLCVLCGFGCTLSLLCIVISGLCLLCCLGYYVGPLCNLFMFFWRCCGFGVFDLF